MSKSQLNNEGFGPERGFSSHKPRALASGLREEDPREGPIPSCLNDLANECMGD